MANANGALPVFFVLACNIILDAELQLEFGSLDEFSKFLAAIPAVTVHGPGVVLTGQVAKSHTFCGFACAQARA